MGQGARPSSVGFVVLWILLAGSSGSAWAQTSCVQLIGGCSPPVQPSQCFPDAIGPVSWQDPAGARTVQVRTLADSPLSSCHPPVGIGAKPVCCSPFHPPASPGPSVQLRVVGQRVWIDYDAPNYDCQNSGDWPPGYTCTNDPLISSDHLLLFRGSDLLARAFIYYEHGSWDTGIDLPCGSQTLTARIEYTAQPAAVIGATGTETVQTHCTDRRTCPAGGGGGAPASGAGKPINVGSGDVSLSVPFFTLAQEPLSLSFGLSYHSGAPLYPALLSSPVGLGWTHPFAQTLRLTDPSGRFLYHLTAQGFESLYTRSGPGTWTASSPGELRGTVTLAGGLYVLTDLDGTATAFDAGSGLWLSTTDRWGNRLAGGYDGNGNLAAVADSEGRQIALSYSGAALVQVTLPDGQVWRLAYDGPLLQAIFDPLHPGAAPWRTFAYAADHLGVTRLLTEMRDATNVLLEGHAYDDEDRGTTSLSEGGRDLVTIEYDTPSPGEQRVTHAIDGTTSQLSVFTMTYQKGRYLPTHILGNCATCGGATTDDQFFAYSQDNHVLSRTDANSHLTRWTYNGDGNVTSITEAAETAIGRTITYQYGYTPWPNFRTEIDEPSTARPGAVKVTTMTWNATGTPETTLTTVESGYAPTDAAPTTYTTVSTFDARHRHLATDGPRTDVADVVTMAYYADNDPVANRRGRLARTTDAVGLTTLFDNYDAFGTAQTVADPNGIVSRRVTDGRGRVLSSTSKAVPGDPVETVDYVSTYTYDGRDRLARVTLPRGNGTGYGYEDGTDRLLDTLRLDGAGRAIERRHLTLNAIGGKAKEEDQACASPGTSCTAWTTTRSESFAYDLHNRLSATLHPVPTGSGVFYAYDPDGFLSTVQDEDHASPNTRYAYDALHRLTQVTQTLATTPLGVATTLYGYDVMDSLTSVTDPNGNVTRYQYDDFRRLARQDSPVTGTTTYRYDPTGNLTATTDARGALTTRTYDAANRLTASTSQLAGAATETVSYAYDVAAAGNYGKGRLSRMSDPSGSTSYTYERRGLAKSEVRNLLGTTYTTGFQYDPNGNRTGLTYPSGRQVSATFDFADRPFSAISGTASYVASTTYLPFGPEAQTTFGNGTVRTAIYDLRYRPVENRLDGSGGPLADYFYSEDPVGNITGLHDALAPGFNRDFAYDDLYRLTGAATGPSLWGSGSYRYDSMGNMTSLALGGARSLDFTYQGSLPKLQTVATPGAGIGGSRAVTYDPAGNELAVGGASYLYSARNLLAAADGLTYTYDGRGVRSALAVVAALGTASGTVVDGVSGAPIAVTVRLTGTSDSTTSDAAGHFTLTRAAGIYTVSVTQAGYLPAVSFAFTLPAGGDLAIGVLRLFPAPGTITGTVLSSLGGQPLPGAVATAAETGDVAVAGPDGTFNLAEPAGSYTLTVALPGYTSQTLPPLALAAGTTRSVGTVTLAAIPAALTGSVVSSATGAPIAGATVTASPDPAGRLVARAALSTTTDAAGSFNLAVPAGSYVVTVTQAGYGSRISAPVAVTPGATSSLGALSLDPLGAVTGTVVRAADGAPVAGAVVTVSGTLNTATTDASGTFSLTQPPGTVVLTVAFPGLVTFTATPLVVPSGGTVDAGTLRLAAMALAVYVGYADDLRPTSTFPLPWQGSANVVFLGNGPTYDAGALRLDNATDQGIDVDSVSVDLGRPGPVFQLWGSFTLPAHGSVVLTQTAEYNFDTSDSPIRHCGEPLTPGDPRVPQVTVTVDGVATTYFDTGHVLDTGGLDLAACGPGEPNESQPWRLIGTTGIGSTGDFRLSPAVGTPALGSSYTLTATIADANQQPLPGVTVVFSVVSGPNLGLTGQAVTDAAGVARYSYVGAFSGSDLWQATIPNPSGGQAVSNPAAVTWPALPGIEVSVGYADDLRSNAFFPTPWRGSAGVLFLGDVNGFDSGAVRIDNTTDQPYHVDQVSVDLQRPGPVFAFSQWTNFTIPPHQQAILAQIFSFNFDSSDYPIVPCFGTVPPTDRRIPKVTIVSGGLSASYLDTAHIIDTFGYDVAACGPGEPNESIQWRPIGREATVSPGHLVVQPQVSTYVVGGTATVEAVVTDAGGGPIAGALVRFNILSGPNGNQGFELRTDARGVGRFSYSSPRAGNDSIQVIYFNANFLTTLAPPVTVTWLPVIHLALSPATAAQAVGTAANATAQATDSAGQPVPNLTVTFRVTAGPDAGKTGQVTTGVDGKALFAFTSRAVGTDTLEADLTLQGGGTLASNPVTVTWTSPSALALAPLASTSPLGGTATLTAILTDGARQPVPNATLTFQVISGPDAGRTGPGVTDGAGQATFLLNGSGQGADIVQATAQGGATVSNRVTVTWTATATRLLYTGAAYGEYSDAMALSARLLESGTGRPVPGQAVAFNLGGQTATAVTGANGTATVTLTPTVPPGAVSLTLSFAGGGGFAPSAASLLLPILRDETVLTYTGKLLAIGQAQAMVARLTDGDEGAPISGRTLTFTFGSASVTATTGADGTATATLVLPATLPTGPAQLAIAFAGDTYRRPARATVPVLVYLPDSFVVWGGNTPGLTVGQRVNFWGSQWAQQVIGGDYAANPSFKGFATPRSTPIALCEATAHTTGTPLLDSSCWTSKPGNSSPPSTLADYIEAIVSTSVAKSGSTIYGNVAATVVLQIDPTSPYGSDPGHPGFGTIVAVIEDGAGLFPKTALRQAATAATVADASPIPSTGKQLQGAALPAVAAGSRQFFLYTPELNLLAETELTANAHPAISNEYIWWNGHPVAQVDATGTTSWTFTDHLGTPILQTSAQQGVVWRAEYEPFGAVYTLRSYDKHQPLRLPGQEAEQLGLGANGVTDRSYNVHRWYEPAFGRYSQADPDRILAANQPFTYADANPLSNTDATGETVINFTCCVLWVKKEENGETYSVQPGQSSILPDQDGYADPCGHPNQVFKVAGQTTTKEFDGADIEVDANHVPRLSYYADSAKNYARVIAAQAKDGGWKDRSWFNKLSPDNQKQWKPLFEAADPKNCSCPCKKN